MSAASERVNGDRLAELRSRLTLPLICAPMFLVSGVAGRLGLGRSP